MAPTNSSNKPLAGRKLADLFFTLTSPISNVWRCKYGTKRTQSGSGYTNLCSHVTTSHPKYATINHDNPHPIISIEDLLIPKEVKKVYGWIEWIVSSLLPFSFCTNPMTRKYSTLDNISDTTLLKWIHILTQRVERTVTRILQSKFALVFDGWTTGSTYYVAIFATFPSSDVIGYNKILLSFSPINDEDSLSALSHKTYFEFVLELFGKSLENVVALIGDNCSTNRALARLSGIPLVGCASHRMNLFVCTILTDHEELVNLVNELMRKLRHVVPAAKLRRLTPLKEKMKNSTHWSPTYHMLQRYVEIKPFVMMIGDREIDALLPSVGQDRLIDELLLVLKDLDTATLALQGEEMSLLDVRNLFDEAMDDYPTASSRLSPDAEIVANPDFENGVVKILSQMTNILNESERRSVERLKIDAVAPNEVPIDRPCLAERAKKRMKKTGDDKQFMDCRFIRPTSNICERLFSMAKLTLTDRRRAMHPQTFEQQVFLKVNMAYWGVDDVIEIMTEN